MLENTAYFKLRHESMPKMKHVAAVTVMAAAAASGYLSGTISHSAAGVFFCIIFCALAASAEAALIYMYRSPLCFISPALSAAAVYLATGSAFRSAYTLIYLPVALAIALCAYKKYTKSRTVITAACAAGIAVAAIGAVLFLLSPDAIPSYDSLYTSIRDFFSAVGINTRSGRTALFTQEAAEGIANYIMLSLPAAFIITVSVSSYIATLTYEALMRLFYFGDYIPNSGKWIYSPAVVTAAIYLLSYFVSAATISYPKADVVGYAAENMLLALLPAMLFTGLRAAYTLSAKHERKILFVVLTVIVLTVSPSLYLMIISFWGAISVIAAHTAPRLRAVMKKLRGDDDDNDDDDSDNNNDDDDRFIP